MPRAERAWKAKTRKRTGERMPGAKVHVGFGAGLTTTLIARFLAERLRSVATPPRVVWHALSSGFNVADPAVAPVAFFNFFHGIPGMEYRGLSAPAYGECGRSRSDALMPLLEAPDLDVWSHLVVDDVTAANCVERDGAMRRDDG